LIDNETAAIVETTGGKEFGAAAVGAHGKAIVHAN
jgi:hypothetical protein